MHYCYPLNALGACTRKDPEGVDDQLSDLQISYLDGHLTHKRVQSKELRLPVDATDYALGVNRGVLTDEIRNVGKIRDGALRPSERKH